MTVAPIEDEDFARFEIASSTSLLRSFHDGLWGQVHAVLSDHGVTSADVLVAMHDELDEHAFQVIAVCRDGSVLDITVVEDGGVNRPRSSLRDITDAHSGLGFTAEVFLALEHFDAIDAAADQDP